MDTSGSELGGEGGRLGELVAVPVEDVPLGANGGVTAGHLKRRAWYLVLGAELKEQAHALLWGER